MSLVKMVMMQRARELSPYEPQPRPQSRNGRAQGFYNYVQVDPDTGVDMASFSSVIDAESRAVGRLGVKVYASTVAVVVKAPLGDKSAGGWWWRRELKEL